jgi:hypothetical protein
VGSMAAMVAARRWIVLCEHRCGEAQRQPEGEASDSNFVHEWTFAREPPQPEWATNQRVE